MKTFSTSIYNEIRQHINSGTISTLPKEKLEEFFTALARPQAYSHFSSSEFPRVCETVKTFLMRSGQNIITSESKNKSNPIHNPREISLYKIAEGVIVFILGVFAIYLIGKYLGINF